MDKWARTIEVKIYFLYLELAIDRAIIKLANLEKYMERSLDGEPDLRDAHYLAICIYTFIVSSFGYFKCWIVVLLIDFFCVEATKITRTNPNQSTAGYEKSNIEIECFFEGLPVPKVTWSKVNGMFLLFEINTLSPVNLCVLEYTPHNFHLKKILV